MTLASKAISGIKWTTLSQIINTALQFFTLSALARILTPSDFGIMGMILIVLGLADCFANCGLGNAIIHKIDVSNKQLSTMFWLTIASGFICCITVMLSRPFIAAYWNKPELSNYLFLASFVFLISSANQLYRILMQKKLLFKALTAVEISENITYSSTALILALAGYGVTSLVIAHLMKFIVSFVVCMFLLRHTWSPTLEIALQEIKPFISFGLFQMGDRLVHYISSNIDYILIASLLGAEALGYYSLAFRIMSIPTSKINPVVTKVAFPIFSIIQDDNKKLAAGYNHAIALISSLGVPLLLLISAVAHDFITVVFGRQWEPTIPVLQIFCVTGIFRLLANPAGPILLAKGKPHICFYWNLFVAAIMTLAVYFGSKDGITGVASAILICQIPLFLMMQHIINKLISLSWRTIIHSVRSIFASAAAMLFAALLISALLPGIEAIARLFIVSLFAGLVYVLSLWHLDRSFIGNVLLHLTPTRSPAPEESRN